MPHSDSSKYYCSQKFTWLSVDVEKRLTYSCCVAAPDKINLSWLKKNPGELFNTELLQLERQQMLDNIPVASCEDNCWRPEREGLTSRRIWLKTDVKTHINTKTKSPTILNINLGSSCNLTCSYCCKQYSSAWRQDILKNGPYLDQDRFNLTGQDKILLKISQPAHASTDAFQLILDEVSSFDQIETVYISGGEPFLYNGLPELLNKFSNVPNIVVFTGLGVNPTRLKTQLAKIESRQNLNISVSGENCGRSYEFNRYGNSWSNFLANLDILKEHKFNVEFALVISNLTIFGLADFMDQFTEKHHYNWCSDPDFLSVNVLDDYSKQQLIDQFKNKDYSIRDHLISYLEKPYSELQRENFSKYLIEFSKRRNLELDIFPESMLKWLTL